MPSLSLDDFLPYRLSIASNLVSAAIATAYQTLFGLKIAEWRLIAVLAEGGAMSQQALGARTRMDKVTVSRAAIALVDRGLLTRARDEHDNRAHALSLSAAGRTLYEQVAPQAIELEAELFADFTKDERATLRAFLARIEAAADAMAAQRA
ncbi:MULTISPECIES: MarR family winged helix-turn-helix transcriptional regulator [unclassified Sphingomonas]|jgi:DNA-binding MarR family transcriptional regulator|uniref:MarR family winged helix-turn-helix transcriptional regulator n=1 Tax=unclassified Sphingomonas TaxID=196159 RepID=UPI0008362BEC|nr:MULTISPECIES: MarR family winged helix-turn-helix transcriptional regulator [unclassified Sphingomonas]MCH4892849.1 MarR family transcriptional regulator [Sphingomonas sp. SFZ2018-12]